MSQKIVALLPDLPQASFAEPLKQSLSFLTQRHFDVDWIDPYEIHGEMDNTQFYQLWRDRLATMIEQYDVFCGFSFGGVILQQCLPLFEPYNKSILLFSSPSVINDELRQKLEQVIALCDQGQLTAALALLYQYVDYPNQVKRTFAIDDEVLAANRLVSGLERVITTDCQPVLQATQVAFAHFLGEKSGLVQRENVLIPDSAVLYTVPGAGNRVLQDNPSFCQNIILKRIL